MRRSGGDVVTVNRRYDASGYALDPLEDSGAGSGTRGSRRNSSPKQVSPSTSSQKRRKRARGTPLNRRGMISTSLILGDDYHPSGSSNCLSQNQGHDQAIHQFFRTESCQHRTKGPSKPRRSFSSSKASKASKDSRSNRNDQTMPSNESHTHLMGDSSMLLTKGDYDDSHCSRSDMGN